MADRTDEKMRSILVEHFTAFVMTSMTYYLISPQGKKRVMTNFSDKIYNTFINCSGKLYHTSAFMFHNNFFKLIFYILIYYISKSVLQKEKKVWNATCLHHHVYDEYLNYYHFECLCFVHNIAACKSFSVRLAFLFHRVVC